jgi:hypothetical protein
VARPTTKPGRLSDVARHVVLPSELASTGWPAVRDKCAEFGDTFDEWQDGLGRAVLGKRADGLYAATIGGITLSIPRQVAKTFLVGRIVVALCILFPGLTVLWTAHHNRTLTRTFRSMQGFVKRKKVFCLRRAQRHPHRERRAGDPVPQRVDHHVRRPRAGVRPWLRGSRRRGLR